LGLQLALKAGIFGILMAEEHVLRNLTIALRLSTAALPAGNTTMAIKVDRHGMTVLQTAVCENVA
jgi:hypothetical protein